MIKQIVQHLAYRNDRMNTQNQHMQRALGVSASLELGQGVGVPNYAVCFDSHRLFQLYRYVIIWSKERERNLCRISTSHLIFYAR